MTGLLRNLHDAAASRLSVACAPKSRGPLSSAIQAFSRSRFAESCPERALFKSPHGVPQGQGEAAAWNEWTFVLLAVFLETIPSAKTGQAVRARTVDSFCWGTSVLATPTSTSKAGRHPLNGYLLR